jgi:hypothetical protein
VMRSGHWTFPRSPVFRERNTLAYRFKIGDNWLAWLDLMKPEAELLRALPAGSLAVEQVR